ncbi:carbohydrate-binding family 9-like protein [Fibrella sp. WM1]|uniref:carbohydrate-binding family 9-like protein n=1 Tax=Fibrella musci TaxID=3242485 RepID=UPI00352258F7
MNRVVFTLILWLLTGFGLLAQNKPSGDDTTALRIRKTADFTVNGLGDNAHWQQADWVPITVQESAGRALGTKVKLLYSDTGLYFLFQADDEQLTATILEDFGALYNEDVVEVFLWPDPSVPIYFEYELSPLNYELPILVPNVNGNFLGWKPWHYAGGQRTQHATSVQGGKKESKAPIKGWTAEFFIPYKLMNPIVTTPPKPGTVWRGNLYRIDYDRGYQTWSWRKTSGSFHEVAKYGPLRFD